MSIAYDDDLGPVDVQRFRHPTSERSTLALTSFLLGIASIFVLFLCYLTGPAAFLLGLIALVKIAQSQGRLHGAGFAVTGILLGIAVPIVFSVCWGLWFVVGWMTQELETKLRDNPVIVKHVGTVPKGGFSLDLIATGEAKGADVLAFKVRGSQGTALLLVETDDDNDPVSAKLRLPSGQEIDVPIDEDVVVPPP
jgi:hypothetical protein